MKLDKLIAPSFYHVHCDIKRGGHTFYKLAGGRGSCKSTFAGIEIILGMMRDAQEGKFTNALALRRYKDNLRGSVYEQLLWGIDKLGVSDLWQETLSPMRLTYKPTGQQILFRGADKPLKIKSIKVARGYIKYLWFEELAEFEGPEKIRNIQQSVLRGGDKFVVFYSYNPPRSQRAWVNDEQAFNEPDMLCSHTTYLTVPPEWLGKRFLIEAEHLKKTKPDNYLHEYLGEAIGTGAEVFTNLTNRRITDEEIASFDHIRRGVDFGFSSDPFAYVVCNYDPTRRRLYIFDEIYKLNLSNRKATELIMQENKDNGVVTADSAEPKSIREMHSYGLKIRGAHKGPDSRDYGYKWLQDLDGIIIDAERCPNIWREFYGYELERDANGNFKDGYPDHGDHCLTGDTIVNTVNGDFPIKDLVGRQGEVYCYDENIHKSTTANYSSVRLTQRNAPVFEIELQDGRTIKATAEHPLYTQRGWVKLKDLSLKDKILRI